MKVNQSWLQEWVNIANADDVAKQLTMAGLEVDTIEPCAGEFTGVVVAHIVEALQHPDADRLRVCQLDTGKGELTQVVCGGKNARAGIKVAFAQVGAVLPGDFKLKKAKLRGVESFGMICSESELGLGEGEDHCIMELNSDAPLGEDIRTYLDLNDQVFDIELTPNRGDCTSIRGVARDLAVVTNETLLEPEVQLLSDSVDDTKVVHLQTPERCSHYVGRVIKGVNLDVATPLWMKERLRRLGLRSINYIVDVTNYVMMELGQPMHAFDLNKCEGDIHVRMATAAEKLQLLDETEIELSTDDLVIADDNKALALAGVMGGLSSAVDGKTTDIFLESAYFNPADIMLSARRHKLSTDSSYRFERGVDFELQRKAIEHASELIVATAGGHLGPVIDEVSGEHHPKKASVRLTLANVERLLGVAMEHDFMVSTLKKLGMDVVDHTDYLDVTIASYRHDIRLEADLIEELARIYGYNNIPAKAGMMDVAMPEIEEMRRTQRDIAKLLASRGALEAMTYSFISQEEQARFYPGVSSITLANPMAEDMAVMRAGLLPGLIKSASYNASRQQNDIRFFELGTAFALKDGRSVEHQALSMAMMGDTVDFFALKGEVETVLEYLGVELEWRVEANEALHPGRSAALYLGELCVGYCGQLHPDLSKKCHIKKALYLFEINLDALPVAKLIEFKPLSKFPKVRRDLAFTVSETINYAKIHELIANNAIELLQSIELFDVYQGDGVKAMEKSMALGLTFQAPDRTLVDEDINAIIDTIVKELESHFNAQLRA